MPAFSRNLEETLHRAVAYANQRKPHEYTTLRASAPRADRRQQTRPAVMRACEVDLGEAEQKNLKQLCRQRAQSPRGRRRRGRQADRRLSSRDTARGDPRPIVWPETTSPGQNVLVAIFSEREDHAASLPAATGNDPSTTRSTSSPMASPRSRSASESASAKGATTEADDEARRSNWRRGAPGLLRQPQREGRGRVKIDPLIGRMNEGRALHSDPLPAHQEQSRCWWATPGSLKTAIAEGLARRSVSKLT